MKSAAQRQAELRARRIKAGLVMFKGWAHPDDARVIKEYAAKLAKRRERGQS